MSAPVSSSFLPVSELERIIGEVEVSRNPRCSVSWLRILLPYHFAHEFGDLQRHISTTYILRQLRYLTIRQHFD
jgi:hypothetical protein